MTGIVSLVQAAGVVERQMETVANNLANVSTVGYKGDQPTFREVLSATQRVAPESDEETFLSHEYLDQYVGMDKSAVVVDEIGKNFMIGRFRPTNNKLDLALENEGFFTVATPQGDRFTRAGNFQLEGDGRLVTHNGFPVMGEKGPIMVTGNDFTVGVDGQVKVDGEIIDRLRLVRFRHPENLQKLGQAFFAPVRSDDVPIPTDEAGVLQGSLEDSNVNSVLEMTRMISAQRAYEGIQRAMSSIDKLNERAIGLARMS